MARTQGTETSNRLDIHMAKDVKAKPTTHCPNCEMELRQPSLRRHLHTQGCRVHGLHLRYVAQGWTDTFYFDQTVRRKQWLSAIKGPHVMTAVTGHSRGGWGHPARIWSRHYLRQSIVDLYYSPQITEQEFEMCCTLPENNPQFQALWTLVRLGGPNGGTK
jgi:hypothetical protein